MTEDLNTKDMSDRELLLAIRNELQNLNGRVATLEARTNSLPPNYDARFTALEANMKNLEGDMKEMKRDMRDLKYEMRQLRDHDWKREGELGKLQDRVEELEGLRAA